MKLRLCLVFGALLSASIAAHADTISNFQLSANLSDGSASGLITIDTTTGTVLSGDVIVNVSGSLTEFSTLAPAGAGYIDPIYSITLLNPENENWFFQVNMPVSSLVDFNGSELCSISSYSHCLVPGSASVFYVSALVAPNQDNATSGSLEFSSSVSQTPEPSSVALLGTGILGIAGLIRRRIA